MRTLGPLALALCVLAAPASAIERRGFIFGLGVGGGSITCDGCDTLSGPAVELHLGGMLGDRWALVVDSSAVSKSQDNQTLYSLATGGALQYWVAERFWLKGGAGFGQLQFESGHFFESGHMTVQSDSGLAFLGGAGVEVVQKRRFAIDLQFRFSTAKIEGSRFNNYFGVVGFNWY